LAVLSTKIDLADEEIVRIYGKRWDINGKLEQASQKLELTIYPPVKQLFDYCCVSKSEKLYGYVLLLLHTAIRSSESAAIIHVENKVCVIFSQLGG
jgi:hypothetical protein